MNSVAWICTGTPTLWEEYRPIILLVLIIYLAVVLKRGSAKIKSKGSKVAVLSTGSLLLGLAFLRFLELSLQAC